MFWDQTVIDKPKVFVEETSFYEPTKREQKDAFGLKNHKFADNSRIICRLSEFFKNKITIIAPDSLT